MEILEELEKIFLSLGIDTWLTNDFEDKLENKVYALYLSRNDCSEYKVEITIDNDGKIKFYDLERDKLITK